MSQSWAPTEIAHIVTVLRDEFRGTPEPILYAVVNKAALDLPAAEGRSALLVRSRDRLRVVLTPAK